MKRLILVLMIFTVVLAGCGTAEVSIEQPTAEPAVEIPTVTVEVVEPTEEPALQEGVVYTTDNEGPGSLRNTVMEAQPGDVITFDPEVFPVDNPSVIKVSSPGPIGINQGKITIDASNAGVILDGEGGPEVGVIVESSGNKVMGMKFEHFSLSGLIVKGQNWDSSSDAAANNIIGGDPSIGDGPYGQGNCFVNNSTGLYIQQGADKNTVTGNFIGVEADGTPAGNPNGGVVVQAGADDNIIGPNNIIANTDDFAVMIEGSDRNTITQNAIYNYGLEPIKLVNGGNREWFSFIRSETIDINCKAGFISAELFPSPSEIMEVFSGDGSGPKYFEGSLELNVEGSENGDEFHIPFVFEKETEFKGTELYFVGKTRDNETTTFTEAVSCGITGGDSASLLGNQRTVFYDDFSTPDLIEQWYTEFPPDIVGGKVVEGKFILNNPDTNWRIARFNEPLKNMLQEAGESGSQAVLLTFQYSGDHAFRFQATIKPEDDPGYMYEMGVMFDNGPQLFFQNPDNEAPPFEDLEGDFELTENTDYRYLMAIDKNTGVFIATIWEVSNPENRASIQTDIHETLIDQPWNFAMFGYSNGQISIDDFAILAYGN